MKSYEDLRGEALGLWEGSSALGLALLIRHGLVKWMEVWSSCLYQPKPQQATQCIPQDRSAEVVLILTQMVLLAGKESM